MQEQFILWSVRAGGWLTSGANYSSNREDAERFSRDKAIFLCEIHYKSHEAEFGLLPVSDSMLHQITKNVT